MDQASRGRTGVALIGAGVIGASHVAALSALQERATLRTIQTRRPERAQGLVELYDGPAPELTADLAAVTEDPDIQAVIVATPPSVRIDLIEALTGAGKHILLEKPVARTSEESQRVVEICEAAGVTLGMVFQHRFRDPSQEAARLIADGSLGALGHVEIAAPLWRDQSYYDEAGRGTYARDGGGVLLTNAIHSIDLVLGLTGPVTQVQAMTATTPLHRMEAEDFAVAGLRFASGAVGSLVASTASFPPQPEVIRLRFENASLRIDRDGLDIDWRDGRSERRGTAEADFQTLKVTWHRRVVEDFLDALEQGRAPRVTGRDALAAHRLIDAIERSSRSGQRVEVQHAG